MSSRLQLDMCNLSLGRRHLVNAYEVKAGIGVIAGNTVWSMPERLECEVLQKARYIHLPLPFTFKPCNYFVIKFHPLIATWKPQSNGLWYNNTVIDIHWPLMGRLLHLLQRGGNWAGPQPAQAPPRCTKCNSPPINGQCTNFILFDIAL